MPLIINPVDLVTNQTVGGTKTFTTLVSTTTAIDLQVGQIKFPTAQNASADANTLDDYEEGTWTVVVYGRTVAGTATYTTQSANYTKIGRMVYVRFTVVITAHTGSGPIGFSGLPFTTLTGPAQNNAFTIGYVDQLAITAGHIPFIYTDDGSTIISMGTQPTGGGGAGSVTLDTAFTIIVSGFYPTN